jgi:hypothetical protein
MYRIFKFLAKVKVSKLLDNLPRNDVVAEMGSGKFNVA